MNPDGLSGCRALIQRFCVGLTQFSDDPAKSYHIGCRWFLFTVSLCFGIAFISLWLQLDGLYGANGISPIADLVLQARENADLKQVLMTPTLFWLGASDGLLHLVCGLGVACSILTALGWLRGPGLLLLWFSYLSFCIAGAPFLNFQWDNLLLEAGLLAAILISWRSWKPAVPAFHPLVRWLGVYLLFRLMFFSGLVKLTSGDPHWASLSALDYHFWTQPLPTPLAWWVYQLPESLRVVSTGVMFGIELLIPFCFFLPRYFRLLGAGATILLQVAILLTGNYGFFNLLTIGLCLLLIDDASWSTLSRGKFRQPAAAPVASSGLGRMGWHGIVLIWTLIILCVTTVHWSRMLGRPMQLSEEIEPPFRMVAGTRSINGYGLFATMTTRRLELTIEGSQDGKTWKPYRFHWKPNTVDDGLPLVAPHMPRVDWQMWFSALAPPRSSSNRWLQRFCGQLLQGNREVLGLLAENPFPDQPPRWIRVRATEFTFTSPSERSESGHIWKTGESGIYWPPMRLNP